MFDIANIIKYTTPLRLLYVEDNLEARESTLIILEEFFNDIIVAVDGVDGLEKFNSLEIDLIITDINMPKKNGLQMIREIREKDKEVPVLVLSAYNESDFFVDSIKLGVEGYLLKPVDMSQFIGMLDKVVQKIKLKDESLKNLHFLHQYQELTDSSSIVSKSDINGLITYVNDACCEISGYTREELIGQNHNILRHPDNDSKLYHDIWNTIKEKKETWSGILRNKTKDGESYYEKVVIRPILDQKGEITEFVSLHNDITAVMNPKKQLIDLVESYGKSIVVLIQIEKFNDIEVYYGLHTSQDIEEKLSTKLQTLLPPDCKFNRTFTLGSGEYAFAIEYKDEYMIDSIIEHIKELQKNIAKESLEVSGVDYEFSTIISLSYGENALMNARYGLKNLQKTSQEFIVANDIFEQEQEKAHNNLETIKMVKSALEDSRIISYFQPIINNKTQEIDKYESLVRLVTTDGKVLSPYFFLDVAKKSKYYSQITHRVLETSFSALKLTDKNISINLSALDIEKASTRKKIFELLDSSSEDSHRIVFELLEDEDVKDFTIIRSFIKDVKERGVKIAIDDFGTGYSNFERLLDYQPDILKIDGSLVKNIQTDKFSLNIIETVIEFAKKQKLQIVAEYVENEDIFIILKELGVDFSQGYYFGKPIALNS